MVLGWDLCLVPRGDAIHPLLHKTRSRRQSPAPRLHSARTKAIQRQWNGCVSQFSWNYLVKRKQ